MKLNKDFFSLTILILITFFFWKNILSIQFQGEGFYYFSKVVPLNNFELVVTHDTFALLFFNFIEPYFKDNISYYFWFLVIVMLTIDITFFYLIKLITKNGFSALLITTLFSLSFIGKFDMFAGGGYQYFIQRGILLLPMLISLIFLIQYTLKKFQFKFYLLSISTFFLALIMGFFGTWFTPALILYPLFYLAFNFKSWRKIFWRIFFLPFPYLLINIWLIRKNTYFFDDQPLSQFILSHKETIVSRIIQQLSVLTMPVGLTEWILKAPFLYSPTQLNLDKNLVVPILSLVLIFAYFGAFLFISRFKPQFNVIASTSLTTIIIILVLNLYKNQAQVLASLESSRYFYYPSAFIVIFWGLFFITIFSFKKFKLNSLIFLVYLAWIIHNYIAIQNTFKDHNWRHKANRDAISIVRYWAPQLKSNPSYVYLPSQLSAYGGYFTHKYYSHPEGKFFIENLTPINYEELIKEGVNPERVYFLHFDPVSKKVIDQTLETRAILEKIKQEKQTNEPPQKTSI